MTTDTSVAARSLSNYDLVVFHLARGLQANERGTTSGMGQCAEVAFPQHQFPVTRPSAADGMSDNGIKKA